MIDEDGGQTDADEQADAAAWLDEDRETIAARARPVDDDLLPEREPRPRSRAAGR